MICPNCQKQTPEGKRCALCGASLSDRSKMNQGAVPVARPMRQPISKNEESYYCAECHTERFPKRPTIIAAIYFIIGLGFPSPANGLAIARTLLLQPCRAPRAPFRPFSGAVIDRPGYGLAGDSMAAVGHRSPAGELPFLQLLMQLGGVIAMSGGKIKVTAGGTSRGIFDRLLQSIAKPPGNCLRATAATI